MRETDKLLAKLGTDGPRAAANGYQSDDEGLSASVVVTCDVNGCVVSPAASSRGPTGLASPVLPELTSIRGQEEDCPERFEYHEGMGWKLGFDPQPESDEEYSAVIGSHDFSISLTRPEFYDFIQLLMNLRRSVTTLDVGGEWGQEGDEATLQMETERLWMQGRAPQKRLSVLQDWWRNGEAASLVGEDVSAAFALRVIVRSQGSREVEGAWHPVSTMNLICFIDSDAGQCLRKIYSESFEAQRATQNA